MTDYRLIKTGIVSALTEVRVYAETLEHIRKEHPDFPVEMPSLAAAIENAIIRPTHVEQSDDSSYVFVDAESTNRGGDPLRVPVKVVEGTSGRMKSAYFARTFSQRRVIWRREDG